MQPSLSLPSFQDAPLPIAFAHRGGDEKFPENTLAAFQDAYDLGYRYFETDVHYTIDHELVAFHDGNLKRVVGIDNTIATLTKDQRLNLQLEDNQHVPLLSELLTTFPDAYFHIDAKSRAAVHPLAKTIQDLDAQSRVCVSSFSAKNLVQLRHLLPESCTTTTQREVALMRYKLPIGKLPEQRSRILSIPTHIFYNWHKPRLSIITPKWIRRLHDNDCKVFVWTVNDETKMNELLDAGVDGLFTDKLRVLKQVLQSRGQWQEPN
jgi:glycerophosphoryl diester phosphodiesterase